MKRALLVLLAMVVITVPGRAQDVKSDPPKAAAASVSTPSLTDAEKVEILKLQKQQADLTASEASLQAQAQAQYQQLQQQKQTVDAMLAAKIADANKKLGPGWSLNADTLEAVKAPEAKEAPSAKP